MPARVEIIGVYPVDAAEPCHLVELLVHGSEGRIDMGMFTQEEPRQPRSNWQVPYDEKITDVSGTEIIADAWGLRGKEADGWKGDVRLVFFFHYLRLDSPLLTPFGSVLLPAVTEMPQRLKFMQYEPPG